MCFSNENEDLLENIIVFGIKSGVILKNNLIASLSITKTFWEVK